MKLMMHSQDIFVRFLAGFGFNCKITSWTYILKTPIKDIFNEISISYNLNPLSSLYCSKPWPYADVRWDQTFPDRTSKTESGTHTHTVWNTYKLFN